MPGAPSDNLFICELERDIADQTVREVFSQYGNVQTLKVMHPPNRPTSSALIRFGSVEEASSVCDLLNGFIPQGLNQAVSVRFANPSAKGAGKGGEGGGFSPYGGGGGGQMGVAPGGGGGAPGGKTSMDAICMALQASGALPGQKCPEGEVFVGGLPPDTTNEHLYIMFSPFGPIHSVKAMGVAENGMCRGFGFVNFTVAASANVAISVLDQAQMPGGGALRVSVKTAGQGM